MKYDVVVVGAGPPGSTAAKFLSKEGVKVLLIDKKKNSHGTSLVVVPNHLVLLKDLDILKKKN